MNKPIAVALVGASDADCECIAHLLTSQGFLITGVAPSPAELTGEVLDQSDILLMRLDPSESVESACTQMTLVPPDIPLVLSAIDFTHEDIAFALQQGFAGVIITSSRDQFAESLRLVALGATSIPGKMAEYLVRPTSSVVGNSICDVKDPKLSRREEDVLKEVVQGDGNKLIARHLMITEATVKVHMKAILRKLQLTNRTQAAIWGAQRDLV